MFSLLSKLYIINYIILVKYNINKQLIYIIVYVKLNLAIIRLSIGVYSF